jgi:competence protein ComEC
MRRPTLIIIACIGFVAGILLGYYFLFNVDYWWFIFLTLSAVISFLLSKTFRPIPIILALVVLGVITVTFRINYIAQNGVSPKLFTKTTTEGTVVGDPYWDKDRNYVFVITNLKIDGISKTGSIKVKTFSSSAKEGNRVKIEGKIYPSQAKPGYVLSYGKVSVQDSSQSWLVKIKNQLYQGADIAIPGDPANFVKGILVGARSSLSQDLQDTLNSTGLSHAVAVSGYNLTILVVIFQRILKKKWLWGSLVLSLAVVWAFVALTGGSASILRAAIMASIFLVASYYGRPLGIFVCLSLTAAITLFINPFALVEDIGWQLSFLSLAGIIVLTPPIQKILPKKPSMIFEVVAITLAAQIATVPYILSLFGKYSLVALLANTLLMPAVPVLMAVGLLLAMLGLVMPNTAQVLGAPVGSFVNFIFDFLRYLQAQQKLVLEANPSVFFLIAWYAFIMIVGVIVYNKRIVPAFQKSQELIK